MPRPAAIMPALAPALLSTALLAATVNAAKPGARSPAPGPQLAFPRTYRGVRVARSVPFARGPLPPPDLSRVKPQRRVAPWPEPPPSRRPLPAVARREPLLETGRSSRGPSAIRNFIGITDNITSIPPDTMGCVGASDMVSFLNSEMAIWDKGGTNLYQTSLANFMTVPLSLGTDAFDPKVLYDQHSSRYIAICLNGPSGVVSHDSNIVLAVSATSDATGAWYRWAIDADMNGSTQTNNWADFPGLGVDQSAVYITANMFRGLTSPAFQYVKVWCIPKAQLLTGSPTITWTEFPSVSGALGTFALQPCHSYGSTTSEHLVSTGSSYFGIEIWRIDDPLGTPTLTNTANPSLTSYDYALTDAAQLGGAQGIETNDDRMLNAVYRDGSIWCTHTIDVSSRTAIRWYELNASAGTITQQGTVSDGSRFYYFPSIAVNAVGDVALGFSGSSSTEYAGAFYTARASGDPAGYMQPVSLLKAGEDYYYKTYSGTRNRWGDYSATCVDPTFDMTFWTLQEYAWTPGGGYDRWGTWWGMFNVTAPTAVTVEAFSARDMQRSVMLEWTARMDPRLAGFNVLRAPSERGPFARANAGLIPASDRQMTTARYTFTDEAVVAGVPHYYKLQQVFADGRVRECAPVAAITLPLQIAAPLDGLSAALVRLWRD